MNQDARRARQLRMSDARELQRKGRHGATIDPDTLFGLFTSLIDDIDSLSEEMSEESDELEERIDELTDELEDCKADK